MDEVFGRMSDWNGKREGGRGMEKKRRLIIQSIVCVLLLTFIWSGYAYGMKKNRQRIDYVQKDDFSWVVQVDEVRREGSEFVLEGFAFKLNQNAEERAFDIVLHDLDTDEYLFPKMEYEERKDVNEYFLCEYDYTKSGFTASMKEQEIDLSEDDFEVLLRPKDEKNPYNFATYLADGKLMYANPKEYVPLDVEGTDLEEVVKNGVLRVYRPDVGMYVYQYEERLFWLADSSYIFEENDLTSMQYQIGTTQVEKLPLESQTKKWYFERREYIFEFLEVKGLQTDEYRVVGRALPTEYSIFEVLTGHYLDNLDKWEWYQIFRPRIEL